MSIEIIKSEIERRKQEIVEIEKMIRIFERAGEDTTNLKVQLTQVKSYIARWEKALSEEM